LGEMPEPAEAPMRHLIQTMEQVRQEAHRGQADPAGVRQRWQHSTPSDAMDSLRPSQPPPATDAAGPGLIRTAQPTDATEPRSGHTTQPIDVAEPSPSHTAQPTDVGGTVGTAYPKDTPGPPPTAMPGAGPTDAPGPGGGGRATGRP
jgi:hypothetical protein